MDDFGVFQPSRRRQHAETIAASGKPRRHRPGCLASVATFKGIPAVPVCRGADRGWSLSFLSFFASPAGRPVAAAGHRAPSADIGRGRSAVCAPGPHPARRRGHRRWPSDGRQTRCGTGSASPGSSPGSVTRPPLACFLSGRLLCTSPVPLPSPTDFRPVLRLLCVASRRYRADWPGLRCRLPLPLRVVQERVELVKLVLVGPRRRLLLAPLDLSRAIAARSADESRSNDPPIRESRSPPRFEGTTGALRNSSSACLAIATAELNSATAMSP